MPALSRNQWLLIRVGFYLAVVLALYLLRGGVDWRRLAELLHQGGPSGELSLSGRELAPALVDSLLAFYARDYPEVRVGLPPGGAFAALEDLLNRRSDLALQTTAPGARVQALAKEALGDTLDWHPIALAALELWSASPAAGAVDREGLRLLLAGGDSPLTGPLFAEAPSFGAWDAFAAALGLDPEAAAVSPAVVFLEDRAEWIRALEAAPGALGLLGGFAPRPEVSTGILRPVAVARSAAQSAWLPEIGAVAEGNYPLHYFLYICHRKDASIEAAKIVTHLTSARGQRQIERTGYLPARRILRELRLRRVSPEK